MYTQRAFLIALLVIWLPAGCRDKPSRAAPEIDWGKEIALDEIIAMAKSGQIQEIEWHVMPNILRAQASDGRIYHIRNENKGIDLRNKLINAGVRIGEGGISFRHVF